MVWKCFRTGLNNDPNQQGYRWTHGPPQRRLQAHFQNGIRGTK
jgi:hypothetical protein